MAISYKITDVIEETGQIKVEFLGQSFMIDLPIDEDGKVPTGAALDHYIQGFIPEEEIERVEKFKSGAVDLSEIKAKVEPSDLVVEEPKESGPTRIQRVRV